MQKLVPYKIVDGQDGAAWVEVQGNKMSPSQVRHGIKPNNVVVRRASCTRRLQDIYSLYLREGTPWNWRKTLFKITRETTNQPTLSVCFATQLWK